MKEWVDYGIQNVESDDAIAYLKWDVPSEITELYLVGTLVINTNERTTFGVSSIRLTGNYMNNVQNTYIEASKSGKVHYVGIYLKKITPENLWCGMGNINAFNYESCNGFLSRYNKDDANSGEIYFKTIWGVSVISNGTSTLNNK